ncbi:MAG: ABC transporter permease [Peptostreptococcaceae bacterium]|nr:ABC transporter permease [Peptostreptococcaceae bacterium]
MNKSTFRFITKKMIRMVSLLAALSIFSFLLLMISPVDPIRAHLSTQSASSLSIEQKEKIAEYWGLDKPPLERLTKWGGKVLQGDLGTSMIYNRPVSEIIKTRFFASLGVMSVAWIMSGVLGFTMGIIGAYYKDSLVDKMIKWYCLTLSSSPVFWIALLILLVFGSWLGWFPIALSVPVGKEATDVSLSDRLYHMVLPAFTLSVIGVSNIALHTRAKFIEVMESDYIVFAQANGKSGLKIIYQHGLRNVALPAITLQFLSFSELFGGSVLVERIFSYPGLGSVVSDAGTKGDMPLLLGTVLASALFVFAGNLIADILYYVIDPRMKEGGLNESS